jgi:hypothetical protein
VGHITAEDLSGNNASTEKLTIEIYNPPPEMEGLGSIRVTEGEDLVLDLRDHLSDANDPLTDLTVRCDNENFMVDGLVLTIHYDIWVPSHGVQLLISDGEDVTVVDLQVKVTNTNGPPEVPHITSPKKNSTWTVGDKITFEGEYGDPDLQEGQILVIVWKSDISGEIARFNNVEATPFSVNDLEVGDHVITVTVSDGEFETSSSIELTVEPRTIMGLPVTIFAILVAVIVAVFVAFLVLRMRGGSSEQEGSRSPFQRRG